MQNTLKGPSDKVVFFFLPVGVEKEKEMSK